MKKLASLVLLCALFFFSGWLSQSYVSSQALASSMTLLDKIKAKKRLDVIILNSPTVYYVGADRDMGFEYELILAYAQDMNIDLNLSVVKTKEEAISLSQKGVGDITVAGLSKDEMQGNSFVFGPKYYMVQEQMICHKDMYKLKNFPKDMEDLSTLNTVVEERGSYENTLSHLKETYPQMKVRYSTDLSTEQLLEMVWKKEIDCTISDSNVFAINQRYFPELSMAFGVSERRNLTWVLREGDNSLKDDLEQWISRCEQAGKMTELIDYYYSYLKRFDYYDTKVFHERLNSRLPKYKEYFKKAAQKYKIPWTLLAAQSYQESHWKANARSHTGVRGMMMLTQTTAKSLGVKNRMDAKESIYAGARYISEIEKRFSSNIKGKDRMAFALAAYNVGMGHVHDAQVLARRMNKNPYLWRDVKTVLPLLSQKKYYKQLKYGYARGTEPVRYVSSIVQYADILNKFN